MSAGYAGLEMNLLSRFKISTLASQMKKPPPKGDGLLHIGSGGVIQTCDSPLRRGQLNQDSQAGSIVRVKLSTLRF
jgi:hypothetical protein